MDHTEFLGDTYEKIADEKAGIIKDQTPVVIGEATDITRPVFLKTAKTHHAKIIFAQEKYRADYSMLSINGRQIIRISDMIKRTDSNLETDLLGFYQRKNLVTLLTVLDELIAAGFHISSDHILAGLKNVKKITGFRGRWDIYGNNPLLICDTAHNAEGIAEVIKQIAETPCRKSHMVIGFVNDKDMDAILRLMPKDALYYFTRPSVPRGLDHQKLASMAHQFQLQGKAFSSVTIALEEARKKAHPDDLILVGGSTFVVADLLESEII
jgi:dihydrofolate synthase/folylpolyglutamate synthase